MRKDPSYLRLLPSLIICNVKDDLLVTEENFLKVQNDIYVQICVCIHTYIPVFIHICVYRYRIISIDTCVCKHVYTRCLLTEGYKSFIYCTV